MKKKQLDITVTKKLGGILTKVKSNKELIISLTSIGVSIVTVFIMISTNNIMITTNNIMETQTEVEKADKLPIINFEASYREDHSGFAVGEIITIHNEGGILMDFSAEEITYVEIEVLDYSRDNEVVKINIPINDYYDSAFTTGALQKKIVTFDNHGYEYGNNKKQFEVINKFMKIMEPYQEQKSKETGRAFTIGVPEFKTFFYVTYKDLYNQKHEIYYKVDHFGAKKIKSSTGKKLFSSSANKFIELKDIDENMLMERIKKKMSD